MFTKISPLPCYQPELDSLPPLKKSTTPPSITCSDLQFFEGKKNIYNFLKTNEHCKLKLNPNIKIEFVDSSDVIKINDALLTKMNEIVGSYKGVPLTLKEFLLILTNEALFNSLILEKIEGKDIEEVKDVFKDRISLESAIDAQREEWKDWGCLIPVNNSILCQMSLIHHDNYCVLLGNESGPSDKVKCPITRQYTKYHGNLQNLFAIVKILVDEQEGAEKSKTSVQRDLTLKTMLLEDGILKKGLFDSNGNLVCGEIWNNKQNKLITTRVDGHDFQRVADGVYRVNEIGEEVYFYTSSLDSESKIEGLKHIQEHDGFTYSVKFSKGVPQSFCYTDDSEVINGAYNIDDQCYYFIVSKTTNPSLQGLEFKKLEGGLDLSKKCPEGVKISGRIDINVPTSPEQISNFICRGEVFEGKLNGFGELEYNKRIIRDGCFENGEFVSGFYYFKGSPKVTKVCRVDAENGIYICQDQGNWPATCVVYKDPDGCSVFKNYLLLKLKCLNGDLTLSLRPLLQNSIWFSGYNGRIENGEFSSGTLYLNDYNLYEGTFNNSSFLDQGLLTIESVTYKVLGSLKREYFSFQDNNALFFRVENQNSDIKIASFDPSGKVSLVNQDELLLSQEFNDGSKITYYGSFVDGDLSGKNGILSLDHPRISFTGEFTNGFPYSGTITLQTGSSKKEYRYKINDGQLIYWSKKNKKHIMNLSGVKVSSCLPMSKKRKSRELMILEFFERAKNAFGLNIQSNSVSAELGYA